MTRLGVLLASLCFGCSSPSLSGGGTIPARQPIVGKVLQSHLAKDCVDSKQKPVHFQRSVILVQRDDRKRVLLSRQGNDDYLAIENQHTLGKEVAYQATIAPAGGPAILHDYRFPVDGGRPHFVLTDVFTQRDTPTGFVASAGRPAVACWLSPVDDGPKPDPDALRPDQAGPQPPEETPTP